MLDLRQAPGAYYELWAKGKAPVPDDRKTVIQTIKFDTADTTTVIAGLGVSPDPPKQKRTAQLKNFDEATVKGYWNSFLTRRDGDAAGAAVYYDTVDPNKKKRTFAAWQTENKWVTTGIGKGDDAYAVYFNSADLGAGRRMGMKAYHEDDGKDRGLSRFRKTWPRFHAAWL